MADAEYKNWQREQRLWWTDVLVTLVIVSTGIDDVGGGLDCVCEPLGHRQHCQHDARVQRHSQRAGRRHVRLGVVAWAARVSAGIVRFAVGFYRSYICSTYLPLNDVRWCRAIGHRVAILGEGVAMLSAAFMLDPLSSLLWVGPVDRMGALIAAFLASFFIYEQTPWYKAAHDGYPQPEPSVREAQRGIFEPMSGPRRGGLLRG